MSITAFIFFLLFISTTGLSEADRLNNMRKDAPATITRLRVYWHDVVSGKNPTSVTVALASSTKSSPTGFGLVQMIDNPLTEEPELASRLVGRAQGFYASASQGDLGLLMNMNLVLLGGEYNGSTITVIGRNSPMDKVRELSIVGGTGVFRLAHGYVELRTHTYDLKTGDATVQYDLVVLH